jgi:steroid delta-isomerase-like uncharacterized protein
MSTEENKAMCRRVIDELINKGNLAVADEVMASNYVYHFPMYEVKGPEGFKELIGMMRNAFPDLNATIDELIAEGDTVAARFTLRGTFKGEMMGNAPTGKQLTFPEAVFIRFENGKEVEATPYANMASFFEQLGISPPGGQGG